MGALRCTALATSPVMQGALERNEAQAWGAPFLTKIHFKLAWNSFLSSKILCQLRIDVDVSDAIVLSDCVNVTEKALQTSSAFLL